MVSALRAPKVSLRSSIDKSPQIFKRGFPFDIFTIASIAIQINPARRTQTFAIGFAQGGKRDSQQKGVPYDPGYVNLVVIKFNIGRWGMVDIMFLVQVSDLHCGRDCFYKGVPAFRAAQMNRGMQIKIQVNSVA
jgi:hypothetical protein